MRRVLMGLVAAATATILPMVALAGNQEVADEIAKNLRDSGRLSDYKIGVKYQGGTAWLSGRVRSQEQMNTALRLVFETPGVGRVVNNLSTGTGKARNAARPETTTSRISGTTTAAVRAMRSAVGALAPERLSDASRLELPISSDTNAHQRMAPLQPATGRRTGRAERVPSSFRQAPAQQVRAIRLQQAPPRARAVTVPGRPIPIAYTQPVEAMPGAAAPGGPVPAYVAGVGGGTAPARYDQPHLPNYAWPSYAAYPNYAALTYPRQYSPTAWPFIGPFYPYPQVPLGWRKVTLEWDDGWWMLDFKD